MGAICSSMSNTFSGAEPDQEQYTTRTRPTQKASNREGYMCRVNSAKPKRIIISFDGTGGEPGWAVQSREADGTVSPNAGGLSNVCKLHLIAGGNIGNTHSEFENQIPIYYSGVGTRGWKIVAGLKSALGFGAMHDIYTMAYEDVKKIYKEGDEIFIFGFSRGAATARLFTSHLGKAKLNGLEPNIAFLGVFDTVVESTSGFSENIKHVDVDGVDTSLPEHVKRAVHFVSIDEDRSPFKPTLFNKDPRVTEVWCPGIHSDIGGGYYYDGLSDNTLKLMQMEAEKAGLVTREITADLCQNSHHTIVSRDKELPGGGLRAFDKDMKIEPDATDPDTHNERSLMYASLNLLAGFYTHRSMHIVEGDKPTKEPILLLDSTLERIEKWQPKTGFEPASRNMSYENGKYFPKNLVGVSYKIVSSEDMSVSDTIHKG